jgi:hypothetical protein
MIIGAHYDHLEGILGADDNASSVAIMSETARILAQYGSQTRQKNLAFVAFDTEERPFYLTPDIGSVFFYNHSPVEYVETIELEARYLSAMTGQDIAPHRPTLDALVSEIKSTYLGRSD